MSLDRPGDDAAGRNDGEPRETEEVLRLDPDVDLDVPVLKIEELHLEVKDLRAHVSVQAELADFFKVNVGIDAFLDTAKLSIKGVEAQARLKVRLEGVLNTIERVLDSIDLNPDVINRSRDRSGEPARPQDASPRTAGELESGSPQPQATEAARRRAGELGIRLSEVRGTGADGRIVVRDVTQAAKE